MKDEMAKSYYTHAGSKYVGDQCTVTNLLPIVVFGGMPVLAYYGNGNICGV